MPPVQTPDPQTTRGELAISATQAELVRRTALRGAGTPVTLTSVTAQVWAVAAEDPDRVALEEGERTTSYGQLARWVDDLRRRLAEAGVGRGSIVAVVASRSSFVPAVFLALESVGAVYVPVEDASSRERERLVLKVAAPDLVVTPELGACPSEPGPLPAPPPEVPADEVRYCIFTSGSTGIPKGALVEHRGMLNHLLAKVEDLGLDHSDRLAFTAPLGFDISVWQMLTAFVCGARVVVLGPEVTEFPQRVTKAVAERQVTILEVVPAVAAWIARAVGRRQTLLPELRWLLCTGEELRPGLAGDLLTALPGTRVMNAYGPTECSDDITHHVVVAADTRATRVPIGRPVRGCVLYRMVHDDTEWRAPREGEAAELVVGGVCVGPGYLGAVETTRRAYFRDVLDPDSPTGRLYRTGDVVTEHQGVLTYLGRSDRQVKVAGVRVELGEIEIVLESHPAVTQATAVLDDRAGRIVAFVVADEGSVESVRGHCRERLVAAVVPRSIHVLPELPRTPHGKIDRNRLIYEYGLEDPA